MRLGRADTERRDLEPIAQAVYTARRRAALSALFPGELLVVQSDDLTVPEELRGIGVRIEDDFLVTDEGNVNLSADLPRAADEVEAWMARLRG